MFLTQTASSEPLKTLVGLFYITLLYLSLPYLTSSYLLLPRYLNLLCVVDLSERQAIQWIVELCAITNKAANVSVTRNAQELEAYEKEKSHVETTAQVDNACKC